MKTPAEAIRSFNRRQGAKAYKLRADLCRAILDLPDNPDIQRVGDRAFTIQSGALGDNWSPEYHDWKQQYKAIVASLRRKPVDEILGYLHTCIATKTVGVGSQRRKLHPGVIKNLQQVIE